MAEAPSPKKVHPDNEELETLTKADLISRLREQEQYIKQLESKKAKFEKGDDDVDAAERLKQQQKEAARRENTLVHRLTTKEQELQDYVGQIGEMKQAQTQGTAQLKSMLLDPAVNIVFQRMAKEMEEAQEKLKQTQNELSAWKFTPDSQTGKRLMARCQMLLQENEELGKTIASGRTAKLEGEIALQKTLVTEMKNNQSELDEFLGDLEEDVEGMQTMIYVLQQQLREAKEQITALEDENSRLRAGDTSVPVKTFPKKPDKTENKPTIKSENSNKKLYNSGQAVSEECAPMETRFYQEKTDSDLEAEYNYEGLYENEDNYQEELESQQAEAESVNYEYEENGYKNYEEEFESQEYKSNYTEQEMGQEPMETDDNHLTSSADNEKTCSRTNNGTSSRTSPAPSTVLTETTNSSTDQQERTSQLQSSLPSDARQQITEDSTASIDTRHNTITSSVPDSQSVDTSTNRNIGNQLVDDNSRQQLGAVQGNRTPEKTARIPSPKPTKVSPVKIAASKQRTTPEDSSHPTKTTDSTSNGSPTNHTSPIRTSSSPNQLTGNEERTSDGSRPSSRTSNDQSPGSASGPQKEREPVLQKFLNGVTSTVDDIEDL